MVGRSMTVYRNPSRQAAARTSSQEIPPAVQEASGRAQAQAQHTKTVSKMPVHEATGAAVYGFAFQSGPERVSIKTPGEVAAVPLSDDAALNAGVTHAAGSPELLIHIAGDYIIDYALYITCDYAKQATFALQANGDNIAGGVWDVPLRAGYQAIAGSTMTRLNENSRIRIVITAASPLEVALTGSGTTASLSVRKL